MTGDDAAQYPSQWETHVVLKDGSTAELRPIKASDRAALDGFHSRQSRESIYFRYFRYRPELSDKELDHFTKVDYLDRMAFVALLGHEMVAVARYERWDDSLVAEVAFFVDDDHHGKGLGTLMLEYLAAAGRDRGLTGFTATVLPENYRMLGVFRSAGFDVSTRFADGVIEVELGIELTAETSSVIADRQQAATARSVARILEPSSVAVIGASRRPGTIGHELVRNLLATRRWPGDGPPPVILPVNPGAESVAGLPATATIADATAALAVANDGDGSDDGDGLDGVDRAAEGAGDAVDLAVVAVRAELVEDVVIQCAEAGVRGLLVVSAGFSETDEVGRGREQRLVDLARDNGMRLIGPAAFGLMNTEPTVRLGAVFHPLPVRPGRVAFASQSGPLAAAVLDRLRAAGAGISSFVGVGNRADVSVNDLLDYWSADHNTDVIVLYVENLGNLQKFATAARRTAASKPIITVRPSSPDLVELLHQSGVILVDEVSQLAQQAATAAHQPAMRGNRVVIVSNAASLARLATAACRGNGLTVVVPASAADVARDDSVLIGDLDTVALTPSADPADYEQITVAAAVSHEVDAVLLALAPTAHLPTDRLAALLDRINRSIDKPMTAISLVDPDELVVDRLPVFAFPEEAARALGRHARWGRWRSSNPEVLGRSGSGAGDLASLLDAVLAGRDQARLTLASPGLGSLLDALGLPIAPFGIGHDLDQVQAVAAEIGFPVIMKAANLLGRAVGESAGAAIDLHDPAALEAAYGRMVAELGVAMKTTIVQRMVTAAGQVRLELLQDPAFGSMVSIGPGGSGLEGAPAVARRFLPVDADAATDLVEELDRSAEVGASDPASRDVLVELATTLDRAARRSPWLARVALNPVRLAGPDTIAVDAEVLVTRRHPDPLSEVRHL